MCVQKGRRNLCVMDLSMLAENWIGGTSRGANDFGSINPASQPASHPNLNSILFRIRLILYIYFDPQSLLTHVSRSTKHTLNRLGVFTVSSFHAYICARSPSLLNNLLAGRGATRRRAVAPILSRSNSLSSRKSQSMATSQGSSAAGHEGDKQFRVNLPDGQVRSSG